MGLVSLENLSVDGCLFFKKKDTFVMLNEKL